jgi:arylsulfatase A-like enzyme
MGEGNMHRQVVRATGALMTRRELLAGGGALTAARAQTSAPRPNIVVFLSDDMGWQQVGFNGGKEVPTPNIDGIARDGIKLTQFYVQPVCTPSRGCILTGRYAWKTGTERRPSTASRQGMLKDERTVAQALADAGYATWMTGKWHLGEWQTAHLPLARGFQHHYGLYGAVVDSFTHTRENILDWHRNGKPVIEEGYSTFLLADEASRLISRHDGRRPFFLYVPFNAVHGPHQAPVEYLKKYEHLGREGPQRAQLECMDIGVGRILRTLTAKGYDNNTVVMFLNDNGGPRGAGNGPYRGTKSAYHEGGIRVPAAIRWPDKIARGSVSDEMLHAVDLFPTFCRLAGAATKSSLPLDGQDALNVLTAQGRSPRNEIVHSLAVIRRGDWKLIEQGATYYQWPEQSLQLYNIREDPQEKRNLAAAQPRLVEEMLKRLAYHRQFAREEEPPERIPNFPPAVYGEEENREHGAWVRKRLQERNISTESKRDRRAQKRRKRER